MIQSLLTFLELTESRKPSVRADDQKKTGDDASTSEKIMFIASFTCALRAVLRAFTISRTTALLMPTRSCAFHNKIDVLRGKKL